MQELSVTDGRSNGKYSSEAALHFPFILRFFAQVFSVIFHPLFIPLIGTWFLAFVQPGYFTGIAPHDKMLIVLRVGYNSIFYPALTVVLLKALGFSKSILLKTQRERIIPYIACGVYYFFMWYVLRNQPQFTREVVILSMAIWIASSLGLIANIYMKVSMHAMSVGVMVTFILLLAAGRGSGFGLYVSAALLITGLVCTARFIVSDHTQKEVYIGLLVGVVSQLIAYWAA